MPLKSQASPARPASRPKSSAAPAAGSAAKSGKRSAMGQAAPAAAGAPAATTAEELKQRAELLERGLRAEEAARNHMQLERDKVQAFWDITKRELADARTEARLKDRELEGEQDRHALELKVARQRVKHLLYEQGAAVARLKADGEATLKVQADAFATQEAQLADDKRRLKQHVREREASAEELIKQFRLDNAKQVSRLRSEFEAQARAIQTKYEAQLRALHQAAEQHYAEDLADLEGRHAAHVANLMARHEAAFADMRAYYTQITHSNLDLIKALKEEIAEMKGAEAAREKLVGDVVRENRRLAEPLSQAVAEAAALRARVEGAERDAAALAAAKARLVAAERAQRATEWELEVCRQRLEQAERERGALQHRFDDAVLAAQQRSAVRAAVLERRLEAASSELALAKQASCMAPAAGGQGASRCSRAASAAHTDTAGGQGSSVGGSRRGSRVVGLSDWVAAMLEAALHTPLPDGDAELIEDDDPAQILQQIAELEAADAAEAGVVGAAAAAAAPTAWPGVGGPAAAEARADAPEAGQAGEDEAQGDVERTAMSGKAQLGAEQSAEPLAALEAKLSQAALAAQSAAAAAAGEAGSEEVRIAAHRGSQLG